MSLSLTSLLLPLLVSAPQVGGGVQHDHALFGQEASGLLAQSLADFGDQNGDGVADFLVSAPGTTVGGILHAGSVFVLSGVDNQQLLRVDGTENGAEFAAAIDGTGDLTGDGIPDFIVGAYRSDPFIQNGDSGSAFVYSGADGSLVRRHNAANYGDFFGYSVAGLGDLNADGFGDYAVGANWGKVSAIARGTCTVYSGSDGSVLFHLEGSHDYGFFGFDVSAAGDVNADGTPDLLVGETRNSRNQYGDIGLAYVFSGVDGSLIHALSGLSHLDSFGGIVETAGDVNGDSHADILVSALGSDLAGTDFGSVFLYSGADASLIWSYHGESVGSGFGSGFGWAMTNAGDIDRDGEIEIAIGAPYQSASFTSYGATYLVNASSGTLSQKLDALAVEYLGWSLLGREDSNGNAQLLIGAPQNSWTATYSGAIVLAEYSPYLEITPTEISAASGAQLSFDLDFPWASASGQYRILISATGTGPTHYGVDIPLTADSWTTNSYLNDYPFPQSSSLHGFLDGLGDGTATASIPAGVATRLIGRTFWVAAIEAPFGQLPRTSSAAVPITIVP